MSTRKQAVAYVHPTGHRPFKEPARLDYRNNTELRSQLTQFMRSKWTWARRIDVDLGAKQILVDGKVAAGFAITEARDPAGQAGLPL